MDKHSDREQEQEPKPAPEREEEDQESEAERGDAIRRLLDEQGGDHDTFNPRTGEDPGLLPLTEDPHERRLKRNTM